MARSTKPLLFTSCSLLMASLFALSTSFQSNDSDWYFWIPLYSAATIVNMVNAVSTSSKAVMARVARSALWLGLLLLVKVLVEDAIRKGIAGIWSVDMRERVVREKFGCVLVVFSMLLQLKASSVVGISSKIGRARAEKHVKFGMTLLVGFSYGLSFAFFAFQMEELKF